MPSLAFVKAAARDIKAYLRSRGSSALVGYSSVDGDRDFRDPLANYLTCGNDTVSLDLYGLSASRLFPLSHPSLSHC